MLSLMGLGVKSLCLPRYHYLHVILADNESLAGNFGNDAAKK